MLSLVRAWFRGRSRPRPSGKKARADRFRLSVEEFEPRIVPDTTLSFSTSDPGVTRPLQLWGLDTTLGVYDLVRRGARLMGPENVNIIRMPDLLRSPLDENNKWFLQSPVARPETEN